MSSVLQKMRKEEKCVVPQVLRDVGKVRFEEGAATESVSDAGEIKEMFPKTFGRGCLELKEGSPEGKGPLKIGVVFSGGQAAGGHNVIYGLFDAMEGELYGFLGGPGGIVDGKVKKIEAEELNQYRNMGGFDLLGSGRTKIETEEQFAKSMASCQKLDLDGLVIIGGDDSNTNAAFLAEYFLDKGCKTKVIGIPKTIDGDLQNEQIAISFGFDTACKVYAELIGNIQRDALSAKKYYHFIKLMGRTASHIALECALATHPNVTLISEEVIEKKQSLIDITNYIADVICKRAEQGKNYGVVLIPEGLIEFIPEIEQLIVELNRIVAEGKTSDPRAIAQKLSKEAQTCFNHLPHKIQSQLLLERDPHGNVQVSKIETEALLLQAIEMELKKREATGEYKGKFNAQHHFLGYEGRAGFPSHFDSNYCYALGMNAALLIREGKTGYISCIQNLTQPVSKWTVSALPITSMMSIVERKGEHKAVIHKKLVELDEKPFKCFTMMREKWELEDDYQDPGPIQFFGPPEVTENCPIILRIETSCACD